jgi:hypothetical protein
MLEGQTAEDGEDGLGIAGPEMAIEGSLPPLAELLRPRHASAISLTGLIAFYSLRAVKFPITLRSPPGISQMMLLSSKAVYSPHPLCTLL